MKSDDSRSSPVSSGLLIGVIICAGLWGSAFPGIKWVYSQLEYDAGSFPFFFAGIRFFLAGLMVLAIYGRSFCRLIFSPPDHSSFRSFPWKTIGLLTLFQTILQYVFFYRGMAIASGVLGSILIGFGSIWWLILSPWILKVAWPDRSQWLAIAASFTGASIAVFSPDAALSYGQPILGALLFLSAALSGALAAISVNYLPKGFSVPVATGISLAAGGVILIGLGWESWPAATDMMQLDIALVTFWLALVSAVAFSIWNSLILRHSIHQLAQFRFLIPLSGVIQSALLIPGESIRLNTAIGGGIVLASIWWTSVHTPKRSSSSVTTSNQANQK